MGDRYRHEYKYFIDLNQMEVLKHRLSAIMPLDANVNQSGKYAGIYNIRSLYFDDYYNSAYYDNQNGTDPREKYRIRIYNHSDGIIKLELKQKRNGKCHKESCRLTTEQTQKIIHGEILSFAEGNHPLLNRFIMAQSTSGLHPKCIVEYSRIPFVNSVGNVRVTIDYDIMSSNECERFLEDELELRPIMQRGKNLLEVKWDEFIPDYIMSTIETKNLQWTSFSKYYLCCCCSLGRR